MILKPFVLRFQLRYHRHKLVVDIRLLHRIPFSHHRVHDGGGDVRDHESGCGRGRDHGCVDVHESGSGRGRDYDHDYDGGGDVRDHHLQ